MSGSTLPRSIIVCAGVVVLAFACTKNDPGDDESAAGGSHPAAGGPTAKQATRAFYRCKSSSECEEGTLCVDWGGKGEAYCKPECESNEDCKRYQLRVQVCQPTHGVDGTPDPRRVCDDHPPIVLDDGDLTRLLRDGPPNSSGCGGSSSSAKDAAAICGADAAAAGAADAAVPGCGREGGVCEKNADCCSRLCVFGVCVGNDPDMKLADGERCELISHCESNTCESETCRSPCKTVGDCKVDADCCNGRCNNGTCDRCHARTEVCGGQNQECCEGSCAPTSNPTRSVCSTGCLAVGTYGCKAGECCGGHMCDQGQCLQCRAGDIECSSDAECCSNRCNAGKCDVCTAQGEWCAGDADCCGPGKCIEGSCKVCQPRCEGRECGDDKCGGSCGTCPDGELCDQNGDCRKCVPKCSGLCGVDDGCGGICPDCPDGQVCTGGECCLPNCTDKTCGSDGCGGSCGPACPAGQECLYGSCGVRMCGCGDRKCGDDGCGHSCGSCNSCSWCSQGACIALKQRDCVGKVCGDDGCGGVCGTCPGSSVCVNGGCQIE